GRRRHGVPALRDRRAGRHLCGVEHGAAGDERHVGCRQSWRLGAREAAALRAACPEQPVVRRAEPGADQGGPRAARPLLAGGSPAPGRRNGGPRRPAAQRDAGPGPALIEVGMPARLCILGPSGRMGRAVLDAARGRDDVRVAAAIDRPDAPGLGASVADGVVATTDVEAGLSTCDVYIDFTAPSATRAVAEAAARHRRAAVIAPPAAPPADEAAVAQLSRVAPIVVAANFSLGVNLVLGLVRQAARVLGPDWDAEVVETHHRAKRDAPSGTALMIARAI